MWSELAGGSATRITNTDGTGLPSATIARTSYLRQDPGKEKETNVNNGTTNKAAQPRSIGRSILALLAGFVAGVLLSIGTDFGLHAVGLWPSLGQSMSGQLLLFATVYRTIYGIIAAYIVARLAPSRPLRHALIGGAIGTVVSIAGAAATWNRGLGPHWYAIALTFVALPSAWVGGRLRLKQMGRLAKNLNAPISVASKEPSESER